MKIQAFFAKSAPLSDLYKAGDAVELPDGTKGKISGMDPNLGLVDIEVTDNPEVAGVKLKTPQNIETPFKRV